MKSIGAKFLIACGDAWWWFWRVKCVMGDFFANICKLIKLNHSKQHTNYL